MIVAEQKDLKEIRTSLGEAKRVLVVGCGTCVSVCFSGGAKEAAIVASSLRISARIDGAPQDVSEVTVQRQCEWEFLDAIGERVATADVVLSIGCGIGVQALAERYPNTVVVPGLNTAFLGLPVEQGVWAERCAACGNCVLGSTAGICPIARCSKQLLNGPCGGSSNGKCEVNADAPCAWQLIYDKLKAQNRLHQLMEISPPKDWRSARDGGPRKIVREDLRLTKTSEASSES
jgi:ferredoxin